MRMKKVIIFGLLGLIVIGGFYTKKKYYDPKRRLENAHREVKNLVDNNSLKNGDIIFQTSLSRQSKAIQLATKSKYSHCGLIFKLDSGIYKWYVMEAVQPVKWTPLEKWIGRGENGKYVIKRVYTDPMLPDQLLEELKTEGEKFLGKNYDLTFEWSDDKIYCSELIWKVYKRVIGLDVGELQKLKDFDLSNSTVKKIMKERYGNKIPMDETVISPISIFDSELVKTVKSNE